MFLPVKSKKKPNYIVIYIFYYKENVQSFGLKKVHFVVEHNTQGILFTDVGTNCLLLVQTWAIKQVIYKRLWAVNRAHVGFVLFHTMLEQQGHQNYSKGNKKNPKNDTSGSHLRRGELSIL